MHIVVGGPPFALGVDGGAALRFLHRAVHGLDADDVVGPEFFGVLELAGLSAAVNFFATSAVDMACSWIVVEIDEQCIAEPPSAVN